jgi:hypothetical protein
MLSSYYYYCYYYHLLILLADAWRNQVGFHAKGLQSGTAISLGSPLIFNTVLFNSGNGYNASTGSFIVPVDSVYMFLATTRAGAGFAMFVDETEISHGDSYETGSGHSQSTSTVHGVLHLHTSQRVWVRHTNDNSYTFYYNYCSFSGFLLSRDF